MKKISAAFGGFSIIALAALCVFCAACTGPVEEQDGKTETPSAIPITSISLGDAIELSIGESRRIVPVIEPQDADDQTLSWSSDNEASAQVDQSGMVSAHAAGNALITASAANGINAGVAVTVTAAPAPGANMTPQEIFASLKGTAITSGGWADCANSGAGLLYANPASLTLIDDTAYPDAQAKREAFTGAINAAGEAFIIVSGDIDLSDGNVSDSDHRYFDAFNDNGNRLHGDFQFNVNSNKTIIGINDARLKFGGISISNKQNVIIRNITFWDAHGSTEKNTAIDSNSKASADALVIQNGSNGVWIDHCRFTDGMCSDMIRNYNHDGSLDIKKAQNITVSWCEFTNHDKVMLVGSSDSETEITDRQVTLHHNYFHHTTQRMPRTRGTQMHIYNNFYNTIGVSGNSGYCMGPGMNAHFIVEHNYFGSIASGKVIDFYDSPAFPARVYAAGNNKTVARSPHDSGGGGKPWMPAYDYTLETNAGLPVSIPAGAGPLLVFVRQAE
jgi:pectate lyase